MQKIHMTKTSIASLPHSPKQVIYQDKSFRYLYLIVGAYTKTFYVFRALRGKTKRVKIGDALFMLPNEARKKALEIVAQLAAGIDPTE